MAARWAELGFTLHRTAIGGLLIAVLAGVLAIINARVPWADMWSWLAGLYTVLGVLGALLLWPWSVVRSRLYCARTRQSVRNLAFGTTSEIRS